MTDEQKHAIQHAQKVLRAVKLYDLAASLAPTQGADGESLRPVAIDMRDAYAGAREDLLDWKRRALEAEDLNRKFMREINGPTHMGEPVIDTRDATPVVDARSVAIYQVCVGPYRWDDVNKDAWEATVVRGKRIVYTAPMGETK